MDRNEEKWEALLRTRASAPLPSKDSADRIVAASYRIKQRRNFKARAKAWLSSPVPWIWYAPGAAVAALVLGLALGAGFGGGADDPPDSPSAWLSASAPEFLYADEAEL